MESIDLKVETPANSPVRFKRGPSDPERKRSFYIEDHQGVLDGLRTKKFQTVPFQHKRTCRMGQVDPSDLIEAAQAVLKDLKRESRKVEGEELVATGKGRP